LTPDANKIVFFDAFGHYIRLVGYISWLYHSLESNAVVSNGLPDYARPTFDRRKTVQKTITAPIEFAHAQGNFCDAAKDGFPRPCRAVSVAWEPEQEISRAFLKNETNGAKNITLP
jgi:hypothetical protein